MTEQETPHRTDGGIAQRLSDDVIIETTPTIRPVLIWFGIATVLGATILLLLLSTPTLLGEPQLTEIVFWIVLLVFVAYLLRFALKMFILTRTRYVVTDDDIRREFALLYRRNARELPMEKIRGIEYNQSRIQSLLGYGTLSFLAGGTNQSLGFVEFEHLKQPNETRERIREQIAMRTN